MVQEQKESRRDGWKTLNINSQSNVTLLVGPAELKGIERKLNDVHNIIDENKKAQVAWYRNKKKVEEMDGKL